MEDFLGEGSWKGGEAAEERFRNLDQIFFRV